MSMDYSDEDQEFEYRERLGIVYWIAAALIISSLISFYVAPHYLNDEVMGYIWQAMAIIGLPIAAWIFITVKSITKFKKIQHTHDFGVGDIIMWHHEPLEITGFALFSLKGINRFSCIKKTIPYSKLENEEIENITPMGLNFGNERIRGYVVSTFVDVTKPKENLEDIILKRTDGENPVPIEKWSGLLSDCGNYAGFPKYNDKGEFIGYADGFETTFHIKPLDRSLYHAAARIEFFFRMPFDSLSINDKRRLFTFWNTYGFISNFNCKAMDYMAKHGTAEVKKNG